MTGLAASYDACRRVNAEHGRTYYLATRLLPAEVRPAVHALYAFARVADEVVDDLSSVADTDQKRAALHALAEPQWDHPVAPAFRDTLARWEIPDSQVHDFLTAMHADLTVTSYATYADLRSYMHGSAAVIGLQLVPLLRPVVPAEHAAPYAADLGIAFQLTNFLRDVGEDLDRGRLYLPVEDLHRFDLTRAELEARVLDDRVRALLAFEIARTRALYRVAAQGIRLLHPSSRPCVETALTLYSGILDEIERQDFPVLTRRVCVPLRRRVRTAARPLLSATVGPRRSTTRGSAAPG